MICAPLGVFYLYYLVVSYFLSVLVLVSLFGFECQPRCRVCVGTLCHLLARGVVPLVPHVWVVDAFKPLGCSYLWILLAWMRMLL